MKNFEKMLMNLKFSGLSRGITLPLLVIQLVEVVTAFSDFYQVGCQLQELLILVAILVTLAERFDAKSFNLENCKKNYKKNSQKFTYHFLDSSRSCVGYRRT